MRLILPEKGSQRALESISKRVDQVAAMQATAPAPAPVQSASQRFQMLAPTNIASTTASSSWVTIDLTELVPTDSVYFEGFATALVTSGSYNGTLDVRQAEGASTYTALRVFCGSFNPTSFSGLFHVPLTLERTFQYRFSATDADVTVTLEARGYFTSPVRTSEDKGFAGSGAGGGDSGDGGFGTGGVGRRGGGETSTATVEDSEISGEEIVLP